MEALLDYNAEGTSKAPKICFNYKSGDFILEGRSIPENASKIYHPLHLWVIKYSRAPRLNTSLHLNLDFFNVATLWWIVKIVKELLKIDLPGRTLIVYLYTDSEDFDSEDTSDIVEILNSLYSSAASPKLYVTIKYRQTKEYQHLECSN